MELHGSGQQTRSFTYVDDLVEAFVRAVDVPAADGEMLNVGNDREITIEASRAWCGGSCAGTSRRGSSSCRWPPSGATKTWTAGCPTTGARSRVLGHPPQIALEDGLVRTIAWQREAMARAGLL